jgi:hypothetical protein
LTGALLLRATRNTTYGETEDFIRYYAPARYLCGLSETEWSPDHNTICDFETLLGEDGVKLINEYAVKWAVAEKLADPSVAVGDTTAQEAAIPYPHEMRLMAAFMNTAIGASKRAGSALKEFAKKSSKAFDVASKLIREYHLLQRRRLAVRRAWERDWACGCRCNSVAEDAAEALGVATSARAERSGRMKVRRVVTGHTRDGKATVASDTEVDAITLGLLPGTEFYRLLR